MSDNWNGALSTRTKLQTNSLRKLKMEGKVSHWKGAARELTLKLRGVTCRCGGHGAAPVAALPASMTRKAPQSAADMAPGMPAAVRLMTLTWPGKDTPPPVMRSLAPLPDTVPLHLLAIRLEVMHHVVVCVIYCVFLKIYFSSFVRQAL